jgi:hypothetical protein
LDVTEEQLRSVREKVEQLGSLQGRLERQVRHLRRLMAAGAGERIGERA